jgi:hypothetical protein
MRIDRDTTRIGTVSLPITLSGGARLQIGRRLLAAGSATFRNWSRSSAGLIEMGGIGSRNTTEWNAGLEFTPDPNRPGKRPIRLGVYRAGLPFPLLADQSQTETGVSAGSSLEFAGGRARADLTLSRLWRSGGTGFSERAFLLNFGISLRP